jgi:hypothetical protein
LTASVGPGETADWYSASFGGILLAQGTLSYTTPVLNANTTYFVQARNITQGCLSRLRRSVTATVGIVPNPTIVVAGTRCGPGTVALEVSVSAGSRAFWYAAASGGSPLRSNSNYYTTPFISTTTTYYVEAVNTVSGCISTRIPITATISCGSRMVSNGMTVTAEVYPNPNQGSFTIQINSTENEMGARVQIRDVVGKLVMDELQGRNVNGQIMLEINRNDLPSGFYTMNYVVGTERGTVKFVITH